MSVSAENTDGDWPYLIFSSGGERYAVESSSVREIVRNNSIYPVPFAPPYVKGIINCYSSPVAAVDWSCFLGKEDQEARKETIFLVLKDCDDLALLVCGIEEFKHTKEISKQLFSKSEDRGYFSGTISWEEKIVPLLDLKTIVDKIRGDLENS